MLSKCINKAVLKRQEMVQCKCFFWHQTETCLLENLCKVRKIFDWLWDLLLENPKLKKTNMMSTETNKKKNSKYEILNYLYFGPNFVFWGDCFRVFVPIFWRRPIMVEDILSQPSTIKKLSTALNKQLIASCCIMLWTWGTFMNNHLRVSQSIASC